MTGQDLPPVQRREPHELETTTWLTRAVDATLFSISRGMAFAQITALLQPRRAMFASVATIRAFPSDVQRRCQGAHRHTASYTKTRSAPPDIFKLTYSGVLSNEADITDARPVCQASAGSNRCEGVATAAHYLGAYRRLCSTIDHHTQIETTRLYKMPVSIRRSLAVISAWRFDLRLYF
jgi:hypothetical protein